MRPTLRAPVLLSALVALGLGVAAAASTPRSAVASDAAQAAASAPEPVRIKGPTRCTLSWSGPDEVCTLPGGWVGEGAGRNQSAASRAAREHLDAMVRTSTDIAVKRTEGTMAILASLEAQAACPKHVLETAVMSCASDPAVVEERLCFADLPEDPWSDHEAECPAPAMITIEGIGYQVEVRGREQVCEGMDDKLVDAGADDLRRASCRAACLRHARVRCP